MTIFGVHALVFVTITYYLWEKKLLTPNLLAEVGSNATVPRSISLGEDPVKPPRRL